MAYRLPKLEGQNLKAKFNEKPKGAFDTHSIAIEVAAILQESVLGVREIKTGKDARGNIDYDSEYSSASDSERGYYRPKRSYNNLSRRRRGGTKLQSSPSPKRQETSHYLIMQVLIHLNLRIGDCGKIIPKTKITLARIIQIGLATLINLLHLLALIVTKVVIGDVIVQSH